MSPNKSLVPSLGRRLSGCKKNGGNDGVGSGASDCRADFRLEDKSAYLPASCDSTRPNSPAGVSRPPYKDVEPMVADANTLFSKETDP
jgi:hypothetical protein